MEESIEEKRMNLSEKRTDVIIPIYNAFEELVRCLESIWEWTDLKENRLILINDNSPDGRVTDYLNEINKENVIIIHNEMNKGFSANINIGMNQSKENDVILLNSDTVVTKNWIEKMRACAYSDATIATVTPLSNNATLCSVPHFCEENKVPDEYSVEEYADMIEKISMKRYPVIPVAHGFCMYVKREVIDKIGMFDAETFGRGYGEENDFCYRAIEAGYCHVMCDDTFILHTGTSSFVSEEKQKYIEQHEKILDDRYPKLMQAVRIHCRDNPNYVIQENVKQWIKLYKRKKRKTVMYLVQSDFRKGAEDNLGGTQLHVKDLTQGLREQFDVVVAARNGAYLNVTLYMEKEECFFKYYIGFRENYEKFRSTELAELYRKIIENFQVDCVHIHHTLGLSLELFYEADRHKIPIFVTMHDFYYICPTVKLLDDNYKLCIGKETSENCGKCLNKQMGIAETVPYISIWREENKKVLMLAEKIFVPSESAKKIVIMYFPELQQKISVVEHGSDSFEKQMTERAEQITRKENLDTNKGTFNVAFLGGINVAKGYRYATEMIKRGNDTIRWHLFGIFEKEDPSLERRKNFVNVGSYEREELPELLQKYQIDLVCILPVWPETFCYTISEAVLCGVPVIVTDIGALSERVRKLECGWIVPHGTPAKKVLDKIYEISSDTNAYAKVKEHLYSIEIRNVEEMCHEYKDSYDNIIKNNFVVEPNYDYKWLEQGTKIAELKETVFYNDRDAMELRLKEVENQLVIIENSVTYRIVRKIVTLNIPFRNQLKMIFKKVYGVIRKR